MKIKFNINYSNIPDIFIIIITALLILFAYSSSKFLFKEDSKDGFLNAKAVNNKFNCRLRVENKKCIIDVINKVEAEKSVLFLGNSQTGAINNFTKNDADYITLLNENKRLRKKQITIRSLWMPNGSLREFSLINETFNKC